MRKRQDIHVTTAMNRMALSCSVPVAVIRMLAIRSPLSSILLERQHCALAFDQSDDDRDGFCVNPQPSADQ